MKITDSLTLDASGLVLTRDGYLVGDAKVARAGNVQMYLGSELGLTGGDANKQFGVYRDPNVVFDEASMVSLAGRPVTRGHPPDGVTADNWKKLAKGQMGGVIRRDGEHVVAPMAIMDAEAVNEVGKGARALSAGYTVDVVADVGVAPDGTPYQFRQAGELRFNHVAYLPDNNPRAGNTRIGDEEPQMTLKTVTVDGIPVEVTDQGATVITTLLQRLADGATKLTETAAAHVVAITAKDGEIAKKDAEIDDLKGKLLSDTEIDKRVQARADLIGVAKAIAKDVKTTGLSDAAIRKAVVVAKLGDDAAKDKSEAYIDARFDILAEQASKDNPDGFRDALAGGVVETGDRKDVNDAYAAMVKDMTSAHQPAATN